MNGYLAIFFVRVKTLFQYRAAAFAGIVTQLFWGLILVMVYKAFYPPESVEEPLLLSQTITFVWLAQALVAMMPWTADREIETQIRSGNVVYELVRPLNLYGLWFSRSLALRLIPMLLRCMPIFIIGGLFLGLAAPASFASGIFFVLSVLCAVILSAAITTFVMICSLFTLTADGVQRFVSACTLLFSGTLVPLPLFPAFWQPLLNWQPFRGVMDIPCRLYTGVIPPDDAILYLGFQLVWTGIFILLGKLLLRKIMRRLIVQGG